MEEAMDFSAVEQEEASFPVGYRFAPTDEELVVYYLMKKPSIHPLSLSVYTVDVYEFSPWSLQRLYPAIRTQSVFFITQRNRKYAMGLRPNREAGEGRWKLSSTDTMIKDKNGKFTGGIRKSLAYHSTVHGKEGKTTWRMHEYRIREPGDERKSAKLKTPGPKKLDGVVLCRIYKTNRKSKSTELKGEDPMPQPRVKMEDDDSDYSRVPLNPLDVGAPSCGFDIPLAVNFTPFFDQHNYNDQPTFYNETPSLPSYDSHFGDRDFPWMHHALTYCELPSTSLVQAQPLQSLVPSSSSGCSQTEFGEYLQSFETAISVRVPVPVPEPEHEDRFPVGVRFRPTEDEIISYYLMNKPSKFPLASVVHMEDYYKYAPWVLHDMYPMVRVRERYFITHREKKYEGGDRPNRVAGCGHWKASGRQTSVVDHHKRPVGGLRQTLIYYIMPGDKKTDWIMQEFRIGELGEKKPTEKNSGTMRLQGYVICKLYLHHKKGKFEDDDHNDEHELDPTLETGTNASPSVACSSASALDELDPALENGTTPSRSVGCPSASALDELDPAKESGTILSSLEWASCPTVSDLDAQDLALDNGAIPRMSDLNGCSNASALDEAPFDYDSFFADPPSIVSMNLWNTNYGYDEEVPAKRLRFSTTDSDGLTTSVHVPLSPSDVLRSDYFQPGEEGKDDFQDLFFW